MLSDSITSIAPTPTVTNSVYQHRRRAHRSHGGVRVFPAGALPANSGPPNTSPAKIAGSYWHPYLPFLGDEVTGKTVAVIGTGRIGLAFIKKCAGFDMNILCFDPAYENHDYIKAIQEVMDLRFKHGISREQTTIRYTPLQEALTSADFISLHVPLLRAGESATPTYHLINESTLRMMKPNAMIVNTSRGPVVDERPWPALCARTGSPVPPSMSMKPNPCPPIRRCAIPPSPTAAACCRTLPAPLGSRASRPTPIKAWPDAACRGLIDVLEGNYGGNISRMPYVVNKEAFPK